MRVRGPGRACWRPTASSPPALPLRARSPQLSIATAIVFYHRFYSRKSYESYDRFRIATTCLFLAGKVEETPKKLKDVVVEAYKAQYQKQTGPDPESKEFWELKEQILVCERILLQTLDFDLTVEHAYRPLLAYVKSIKGTRDLAQVAWNFINDSLRTTIALQYPPRCVAAAAVSLASRFLGGQNGAAQYQLPMHHGKAWTEAFKVAQSEVDDIAEQILVMYDGKGQAGPGQLTNGNVVAMVRRGLVERSGRRARYRSPRLTSLARAVTGLAESCGVEGLRWRDDRVGRAGAGRQWACCRSSVASCGRGSWACSGGERPDLRRRELRQEGGRRAFACSKAAQGGRQRLMTRGSARASPCYPFAATPLFACLLPRPPTSTLAGGVST